MRSSLGALIVAVTPWLLCAADDTPSWLKDLNSVTLPQYPAKVNRVVLFNEEQTVAADNGRLTTTTRTAIKFLNRQGGEVMFFDSYDAPSSKVRDFRAWMISPAGKVRKYGKDEIVDAACAGNDVYNECRKRLVSAGRDAEAGAIFAYESVIEYQVFANQLSFHFQDSFPVRLARFIVTAPAGWEIKSDSFNGAPREAAPSNGTYTWQMENLPAIEREPGSPSLLTVAPWVGVNLLGPAGRRPVLTWPEAAKVLSDLNEGQADPDAAISAKARSLVEGTSSELDKIRAIGRFTQQVNYVSIQVNVSKGGGYKPHNATQVFTKLYGDCKDKANLTRAMLKAVGITAYPVAIYSGDRTHVSQEWPSLGAFNHAISAIRVGPDTKAPAVLDHPKLGRLLFFDPTDPYVTPGHLPDHEQASLALVAAGDGGDLVRVPAAAPVASDHDRQVEALLGADGSIGGRFVDKRTGEAYAEAISAYRGSARSDYTKTIERWVGHSIAGATTTNVEVEDGRNELVIRAQFASTRFAQRPQPKMLIFKAGLIDHGNWRLIEKTRKYPIVVDTDMLQEVVRIQLPADFKIDELPGPMKIESPFGKYEATWTADLGAIVFKRKLEMPAQTVPASQYVELKKFLDAVASSSEMPVVLIQ
jgi:transglutaminase-like putative cysteine protease